MAKYFDKFPTVSYDNTLAKNILARVSFDTSFKKDQQTILEYTLPAEGVRADTLSNAVYNSPYYDWLVYMTNGITDPYYGLYLSEKDMNNFIIKKYGSEDNARNIIVHYRNNWYDDESILTISQYDALDYSVQRYYSPNINNANQVISYKRKQEDWIQSTNKIIELKLNNVDGFEIGYTIIQNDVYGGAYGTVCNIDKVNNILSVQHVYGDFTVNPLYMKQIFDITVIAQIIPDSEASFWSPVTAYDYEHEQNELRKYVNLIKPNYLTDIEKQFNGLIKTQ